MNARHRRFLKLLFVTLLLLVPSLTVLGGVSAAGPCPLDNPDPNAFPAVIAANAPGYVARDFSTLRTAPAGSVIAVVYSPANFIVTAGSYNGQTATDFCVNNLRWLHIVYVDGNNNPIPNRTGWALASQNFYDGLYGPGTWLAAGTPPPPPPPVACDPLGGNTWLSGSTAFPVTPTTGQIAQVFSTLRPFPTAPDWVSVRKYKATFPTLNVLSTQAVDGYCWLEVAYSDGSTGWALENQIFPDPRWGVGPWIIP